MRRCTDQLGVALGAVVDVQKEFSDVKRETQRLVQCSEDYLRMYVHMYIHAYVQYVCTYVPMYGDTYGYGDIGDIVRPALYSSQ